MNFSASLVVQRCLWRRSFRNVKELRHASDSESYCQPPYWSLCLTFVQRARFVHHFICLGFRDFLQIVLRKVAPCTIAFLYHQHQAHVLSFNRTHRSEWITIQQHAYRASNADRTSIIYILGQLHGKRSCTRVFQNLFAVKCMYEMQQNTSIKAKGTKIWLLKRNAMRNFQMSVCTMILRDIKHRFALWLKLFWLQESVFKQHTASSLIHFFVGGVILVIQNQKNQRKSVNIPIHAARRATSRKG